MLPHFAWECSRFCGWPGRTLAGARRPGSSLIRTAAPEFDAFDFEKIYHLQVLETRSRFRNFAEHCLDHPLESPGFVLGVLARDADG